jgi:signal transduction histidine kinase
MACQLGERAGAAITNAHLYEQATHAITLRDEFLSIAGHELRTPLATMSLHVEAVLALPDTLPLVDAKARIGKLTKQTERLTKLVEELLDVTRMSASPLALERERLDLGELARDLISRFALDATRVGTPIMAAIESVAGNWDRTRIEQIVTNLISNALKYGKGKRVDVVVKQQNGAAVLTVTDRGIGIAVPDQSRIFERFERAVSSRRFGGLGLGLWIVRQLVESHGGSISVASTSGEGSTFTVHLPIEPAGSS